MGLLCTGFEGESRRNEFRIIDASKEGSGHMAQEGKKMTCALCGRGSSLNGKDEVHLPLNNEGVRNDHK